MALTRPLVLGAGPAGSLAATLLARGGAQPLLIDRDAEVGNALCGGFMSWRTAARLRAAGLNLDDLGAHRVNRLALYAGKRSAFADLPDAGFGLSRHALDTAMRAMAVDAGAELAIDHIRQVEAGHVRGDAQEWRSNAIFLASGKHDVRGLRRPRADDDAAVGIRIAVPGNAALTAMLANTIELHFFPGGYAGIVLQEDQGGAPIANICLAVRKSLLVEAGGIPRTLLDRLANDQPQFGKRMVHAAPDLPIDTIGAVPYGWIARDTLPGLFRLGDQAAVIPSLAGEGMAIALASAEAAVGHFVKGGPDMALRYQRDFARQALRPVKTAKAIWNIAEKRHGGALLTHAASLIPSVSNIAMRASRI